MSRALLRALVAVVSVAIGTGVYVASSRQAASFEATSVHVLPSATEDAESRRADLVAAAVHVEVLHDALLSMGVPTPDERAIRTLRARTDVAFRSIGGEEVLSVRGRAATPERAMLRAESVLAAVLARDPASESVRAAVDVAHAEIQALERRVGDLSERIRVLQAAESPEVEDRIAALTRERSAWQERLDAALQTRAPAATGSTTVREMAGRELLNALIAAAAVVAVAGLLAGARPRRRRSEPPRWSGRGLPVLATFPASDKMESSGLRDAGNSLMMGVIRATEDVDRRVVLLTSLRSSEGSAMVAVQLAKAFASYGYRTLLVDGDLHGPSVARRLSLEERHREEGSRRAPASAAAWFAAPKVDHAVAQVAAARGRHVDVVPQFRPARYDPVEMAKGFREALLGWSDYDVVVVGSAPWSSSEDALALTGACTATVLVHEGSRVERRRIGGARRALLRRGGVPIGLVRTGDFGARQTVAVSPPGVAGRTRTRRGR